MSDDLTTLFEKAVDAGLSYFSVDFSTSFTRVTAWNRSPVGKCVQVTGTDRLETMNSALTQILEGPKSVKDSDLLGDL